MGRKSTVTFWLAICRNLIYFHLFIFGGNGIVHLPAVHQFECLNTTTLIIMLAVSYFAKKKKVGIIIHLKIP